MSGQAREIPKEIIDLYFLETVGIKYSKMLYFDFAPLWDLFQKGIAKEYVYPNISLNNVKATRFLVLGSIQGVNHGAWIRKQARYFHLIKRKEFNAIPEKDLNYLKLGD